MILRSSRNGSGKGSVWSTQWEWNLPHSVSSAEKFVVCFEILIDFKPDCVASVKKGTKHVLGYLEKLWEKKTMSDVTFKCGDEFIKAHTLILDSGSPVLAAMFQNDFKEHQERMVLITDMEAKTLENLFHHIYVGECDLLEKGNEDGSEVAVLLIAADKYAVDSLKEDCELHRSKILTLENVTHYLVFANLHNAKNLYESALEFISKNAKEICSRKEWMEIIQIYPELCFQAPQSMVKFLSS